MAAISSQDTLPSLVCSRKRFLSTPFHDKDFKNMSTQGEHLSPTRVFFLSSPSLSVKPLSNKERMTAKKVYHITMWHLVPMP
jgi:hypothetical protein